MCRKRLHASKFVQYFLKQTLVFLNYYSMVSNLVNRWRLLAELKMFLFLDIPRFCLSLYLKIIDLIRLQ
jgi:hypothetical protein